MKILKALLAVSVFAMTVAQAATGPACKLEDIEWTMPTTTQDFALAPAREPRNFTAFETGTLQSIGKAKAGNPCAGWHFYRVLSTEGESDTTDYTLVIAKAPQRPGWMSVPSLSFVKNDSIDSERDYVRFGLDVGKIPGAPKLLAAAGPFLGATSLLAAAPFFSANELNVTDGKSGKVRTYTARHEMKTGASEALGRWGTQESPGLDEAAFLLPYGESVLYRRGLTAAQRSGLEAKRISLNALVGKANAQAKIPMAKDTNFDCNRTVGGGKREGSYEEPNVVSSRGPLMKGLFRVPSPLGSDVFVATVDFLKAPFEDYKKRTQEALKAWSAACSKGAGVSGPNSWAYNCVQPVDFKTYVAAVPVLYVAFDDLLVQCTNRLHSTSFQIEAVEPLLYVYSDSPRTIHIREAYPGLFRITVPALNASSGWLVETLQDGKLRLAGAVKTYPYLFWEGPILAPLQKPLSRGFAVRREHLNDFFDEWLPKLGLRGREILDFKSYWLKRLKGREEWLLTFFSPSHVMRFAPIDFDPKPALFVRVLMDYQPLPASGQWQQQTIDWAYPELRPPYTIVEWGRNLAPLSGPTKTFFAVAISVLLAGCRAELLIDRTSLERSSEGRVPLRLASLWGLSPEETLNSCASCHPQQHREWLLSAHAKAGTDPHFRRQLAHEGLRRCIHCHAPFAQDSSQGEVADTSVGLTAGVHCLSCHTGLGTRHPLDDGATKARAKSAAGESCFRCHEFHFGIEMESSLLLSSRLSQSTVSEWNDYRKRGGSKTCIECHMPVATSHALVGLQSEGHESRVKFAVEKEANGKRFLSVDTTALGHRFPTGDILRIVELQAWDFAKARWKTILAWGRTFSRTQNARGFRLPKEDSDTRLGPGKLYRFPLTGKESKIRVMYYRDGFEKTRQDPLARVLYEHEF